jgi:hypothetical protein
LPPRPLSKSIESVAERYLKVIGDRFRRPYGRRYSSTLRGLTVLPNRVGAASSLASVSRAGGFDEARGFTMFLAGIRIFDELKKRRFGHHP